MPPLYYRNIKTQRVVVVLKNFPGFIQVKYLNSPQTGWWFPEEFHRKFKKV